MGKQAGWGGVARAECAGRTPQVTDVSGGSCVLKSVAVGLIFVRVDELLYQYFMKSSAW